MIISDCGAPFWCSALVVSVCLAGACTTKSSPTEPSGPTSTASAARGTVTESLTGAPIDGATLSFSVNGIQQTLTTSGGGVWQLEDGRLPGNVLVEVSAPGYLTRRTHTGSVAKNGEISFDLIRNSSPFSLEFYRQLIRNQFEAPGNPPALRRWTRNPAFYVNTRNPRTGQDLSASEQELIRGIINASVANMTGGQLAAAAVEFGSGTRAERSGVVNVTFVNETANQFCGWSRIGSDPGAITMNLASRCDTPCGPFAPRTLAHEVGHALGFYHVERGDILSTKWSPHECGDIALSSEEQHHARLAYARSPGNRDTDYDPLGGLLSQSAEPPRLVECSQSR